MKIKSIITKKEYDTDRAVYLRNWAQFEAYMANGCEEFLLDIYYDSSRPRNKMVFVFEKCPETRQAKEKWDAYALLRK